MVRIPTLKQLFENINSDLKGKLNVDDNEDLKEVLDALSATVAGQFKLAYIALSDIQKNSFPDKADLAENGGTLSRFGDIHLNRIKRPATSGIFQVKVLGENGASMRDGLTFKSNDDALNAGKLYILDVEHLTSSQDDDFIEIRSIKGGVDYLLEAGDKLTITEPVIGVNQTVTVVSVIEQPLAEETEEKYRRNIIESIQLEPQGGSKTDYRIWASDVQGVRYVYPYVKEGSSGTVQVYVESNFEDSIDDGGTPSAAILKAVENAIEFDSDETKIAEERGRRPISATVEVLPIERIPVDVNITGLNFNSSQISDSIELNLNEYLKTVRPFVAGADLLRNKNDILYAAKLQSVVTSVIDSGNLFNDFSVLVDGISQNSFVFERNSIPFLREVNYI